jgi:hypothetical protein
MATFIRGMRVVLEDRRCCGGRSGVRKVKLEVDGANEGEQPQIEESRQRSSPSGLNSQA